MISAANFQIKSNFPRARNNVLGKKYLNSLWDPGSWMEKFGSGIRNKQPGSATLRKIVKFYILKSWLLSLEV
jgi:hypothetical protein